MECGDGLGVSVHCHIMFVHIDVITLTLGMPEPHQAPPLQTAIVNHPVEQPLRVIKDSPGLQTCTKGRLLRPDTSLVEELNKAESFVVLYLL